MPNWCINYCSLDHDDPSMVTKAANALREGKLFETFVPLPNKEWDYGWCVENWGTKWDATCVDVFSDDGGANLIFDTAWGPPIAFYEAMEEIGFRIDATYHESGMAFAGHYCDGDDNTYEYDFDNPNWADEIDDQDVVDLLEEEYNLYLEMQEEEEE